MVASCKISFFLNLVSNGPLSTVFFFFQIVDLLAHLGRINNLAILCSARIGHNLKYLLNVHRQLLINCKFINLIIN